MPCPNWVFPKTGFPTPYLRNHVTGTKIGLPPFHSFFILVFLQNLDKHRTDPPSPPPPSPQCQDMNLNEFSAPLPNGITVHHLELHNLSIREARPIIEFEYSDADDDDFILTVFGRERAGLLADLTDYLESTSLNVKQANIYSLPNGAIMDQFTLNDPHKLLKDDDMLRQIHDTLVAMVDAPRRRPRPGDKVGSPSAKDSLYNYELLNHRIPITLLAPRGAARSGLRRRFSSNIALTEMEEEQRMELERARRKSEAVTANFVDHAISSLVEGDFLYYYSSSTRYRHRFHVSEDRRYLCWADSRATRLSRYAGVLFGPKSATFQDLGPRLVDPEWLCFSLVSNPSAQNAVNTKTIDLVCVSIQQMNRWLLGLQSLCNPDNKQLLHNLTLDDLTKMRAVFKIRGHAHARGLTVRRYFLKRVREAGKRRSRVDANRQHLDEVKQLESELTRLQKTLIDSARRETLLNTSLRDFQTSWEVSIDDITFFHPIGQGAFSEMWKGSWHCTPVAVKRLTTKSISGGNIAAPDEERDLVHDSSSLFERVQRLEGANMLPEDRRLLHDFRLEVTMLNKMRHPNVVLFLGACTVLPRLCILTEFCHGGSLFAALRKRSWRTSLSLQDLRAVARHMARGMRYLHACHVIHRDLKSQNLLLDRPVEDGCPVVKVADFGLSRNFTGIGTVTGSVSGIMTSETGTYRWMAPEMIRHEPYNEKVDVYSYGVVLWELFSCEVPFAGMTPIQAAFAVADKDLRPKCESDYAREVTIPVAWQALIEKCWHKSSHERPRFSDVLNILDEMETCADGEIPESLRGSVKIRLAEVKSRREEIDLDDVVEQRNGGTTGLGHSSSAPNLSNLE